MMRLRLVPLVVVLALLALSLTGCFDRLFVPEPEASGLSVTEPKRQANGWWTASLRVAGMPEDVCGLLIEAGGLRVEGVIHSSIEAVGASGFIVTAQQFEETPGAGGLIAVCSLTGVRDSEIVRFTFRSIGESPTIALDESKIHLANQESKRIVDW